MRVGSRLHLPRDFGKGAERDTATALEGDATQVVSFHFDFLDD